MTSKKVYWAMCLLFCLLIIGFFGSIIFGNSILKQSASSLLDLKLKSRILNEQQTALTKAKNDIEKYQDFDKIAKTVVPQDKDQAKAVREIIKMADQSNINIGSVAFPASDLGDSSGTKSTVNQNPDAPKSAAEQTPASSKSAVSQAVPVPGVSGVYSLEMNIMQDSPPVTFTQLLTFLKLLENNRRTAQVTQIRIDPIPNSPNLTFTLTINIFIKPS